jgi:hypothetical protein
LLIRKKSSKEVCLDLIIKVNLVTRAINFGVFFCGSRIKIIPYGEQSALEHWKKIKSSKVLLPSKVRDREPARRRSTSTKVSQVLVRGELLQSSRW